MWQCFTFRKQLNIYNVTRCCLAFSIALVLFVAGCGARYIVEPDRTTYPRDLSRQQHVQMPILPGAITGAGSVEAGNKFSHQSVTEGRPFLEFEQTVVGDKAVHEIAILSGKRGGLNEASLLARTPEAGHQICGRQYRIIYTKYYKGTEATSGFLGRSQPWLKVVIRCPLDLDIKGDRRKELIASVSKNIPEADYFDIHQKDYTFGVDKLRAIIEKVITARGMKIKNVFQAQGMDVILTDRHRSGIVGFPVYEQLIAVLAKSGNVSVLTARLLVYNRDFEGRSDATERLRLIPADRDHAYKRVGNFLGEITKALDSQ